MAAAWIDGRRQRHSEPPLGRIRDHLFHCNCTDAEELDVGLLLTEDYTPRSLTETIEVCHANQCEAFQKRFKIIGLIGNGTFGAIFVARDLETHDTEPEHYAVKIQAIRDPDHDNVQVEFEDDTLTTHNEAMMLWLAREAPNVSHIRCAYVHGPFAYIVMDLFALKATNEKLRALPPVENWGVMNSLPLLKGFDGKAFLKHVQAQREEWQSSAFRMRHRLRWQRWSEAAVCKVFSGLLSALMGLEARYITHQDISRRNYLVEEATGDVRLLDFDQSTWFPPDNRDHFTLEDVPHIHPLEHMISPQLIRLMEEEKRKANAPKRPDGDWWLKMPHDSRVAQLWRIGVLIFELLHGYAPWEHPKSLHIPLSHSRPDRLMIAARRKRKRRRRRMLKDPVAIGDLVSQEAADVLRAMLQRESRDRPNLEQLITFPWFQDWSAESVEKEGFGGQKADGAGDGDPGKGRPNKGRPSESDTEESRPGGRFSPMNFEEEEAEYSESGDERTDCGEPHLGAADVFALIDEMEAQQQQQQQ